MSTQPASQQAQATNKPAAERKILVWDIPVRLFHWLTVLSFVGAYLTSEGERWRTVHVTLGYTLAGLIAFRLVWGCIGTRYARFSSFVRGPDAIIRYLRSLASGRPEHFLGHTPAGALAIIVLLFLGAVVTGTGWLVLQEINEDLWEEVHEILANIMLAVVAIHIGAVAISSRLHRENLVASMITGKKVGLPEQAAQGAWRSVGILILVAVLGFWWLRWHLA